MPEKLRVDQVQGSMCKGARDSLGEARCSCTLIACESDPAVWQSRSRNVDPYEHIPRRRIALETALNQIWFGIVPDYSRWASRSWRMHLTLG